MTNLDFYGAALLGAAIRTVFPKASYQGTKIDPRGFAASFSDDTPFQEGYLSMLADAMEKLSEEPVETMEMLGSNAEEMLAHHGQSSGRQLKGTVWVLKIGSLFEICEGRPDPAKDFALLSFSQEGRRITIRGKAFESKEERQRFEKRYRKWIDHHQIAKTLELYEGKTVHPRGVLLRHLLLTVQRKFLEELGFLEIEASDPVSYAKEHQLERVVCGKEVFLFGPDSLNSSLQIIEKWINIFGFDWIWAFGSRKPKKDIQKSLEHAGIPHEVNPDASHSFLEWRVVDYLGCYQRGAGLEPVAGGFRFSLTPNLSQWMALLLEKDRGELPGWLIPEQVRLLTEKGVEISQVTKIFRIANIRYTVDFGAGPLKEKIYRALRVNVPCVMVFGNHEEKASQMMIRTSSSNKSETIVLTRLHQFLSELQIESE